MLFHIVVLVNFVAFTTGDESSDLITSLPDVTFPLNFKQYSGYLDGSLDGNIQMHYWFLESQSNPATDPLIIWLSGGPGCSSIDSLLQETGPFIVRNDGVSFRENDFAWNKIANIFYLTSPVCVGYSYYKNGGSCATNDTAVAEMNYQAVLSFFVKFPQYAANDFFVIGESYAGIYVPTLALKIAEGGLLNLKGFATGNGLLSNKLNTNSVMYYSYYHSIMSPSVWENLQKYCCNTVNCMFTDTDTSECQKAITAAMTFPSNLMRYDIYQPCSHATGAKKDNTTTTKYELALKNLYSIVKMDHSQLKSGVNPPCAYVDNANVYMNQQSVRTAIHIPDSLGEWSVCTNIDYTQIYSDMSEVFKQLHSYGIVGLVYNGDVDTMCNVLGAEWFVDNLNYTLEEDWKTWSNNRQIGGWRRKFDKLHFYTVRGAGHMVPEYKPSAAFYMLSDWLSQF